MQQSLSNCLKEYGYNFQAIHCGGDEPVHQEREQWSDGANAFTLSPGKIIRQVTEEEKKEVFENTKHYQDNWKKYSKSIF